MRWTCVGCTDRQRLRPDAGARTQDPNGSDEPVIVKTASTPVQSDARYVAEMVRAEMIAQYGEATYASGYQVATDRLLQIELVKRRALGTQSELLGPDMINNDLISRTFDFQRWGAMNRERLREEDPAFYNFVVSWIAGVNQRIEDVENGDAPLPPAYICCASLSPTYTR